VITAALSFGLFHIAFGLYVISNAGGCADMNDSIKPDDIDPIIHERVAGHCVGCWLC
jgi:hypothetical protein